VAVGNEETGTSQPLTTLRARDGIPDWNQIGALLQEWKPTQLIVGLPLNMDDSESELSQRARKFGRRLEGRFAISVSYMDERLSSFEAKQQLREQGHRGNYKDNPADSVAAELILRSWLASRA
jgi:putative Holliday junction resolvase